eukprot:CAMPEP_0174708010 /NCGR_PEP_ID=MMETSP1094-20130205/10368_1 /TAXON_ID=156173 /ORGANISM="Chrysochromulina brevifilum, Strain UTEX LB 985" /LENGTH=85 /DNA_ID=CAMNT_0015906493 /DNA_START=51 /DNA_END=309 /DNA_ORIENTATION=-
MSWRTIWYTNDRVQARTKSGDPAACMARVPARAHLLQVHLEATAVYTADGWANAANMEEDDCMDDEIESIATESAILAQSHLTFH